MNEALNIGFEDIKKVASPREVAVLMQFTSHTWRAEVNSKRVLLEIAKMHGAKRLDIGKASLFLLPGADKEYQEAHAALRVAYENHTRLTRQWPEKGMGLIVNNLIPEYFDVQGKQLGKVRSAAQRFQDAYPAAVERAKDNLGSLVDYVVYPEAETIADRFGFNVKPWPIPDSNDFIYLPENFQEAFGKNVSSIVQSQFDEVVRVTWHDLKEKLEKIHESLADADKAVYDSHYDHLRDVLKIIKHMNVTHNPEFDAIITEIEQTFGGIDKDGAKASRGAFAEKANNLVGRMFEAGLATEE